LKRLGVPALVFVPSALVAADWEKAKRYCIETTHHRAPIELLNWTDLSLIVSSGYDVGSHTQTHTRLNSDPGNVEREILGSKREIEDHLGVECGYLAWPYGEASRESITVARAAGYRAAFCSARGRIVPGQSDKFRIPRHHFEPHWPLAHVRYFAQGHMEQRRGCESSTSCR
jgi:peptidoglycan/xylan/chitin deacetylase (PgdA/CDA1 family)